MTKNFYIYRFAEFEFDTETEGLFRDGQRVPLTEKEAKILFWFIKNPNVTISPKKFLDNCWGADEFKEESNVTVHVHRIRKKLGGDRNRYIINEKKRDGGYIFIEKVRRKTKPKNYSISNIFDEDNTEEAEAEIHAANEEASVVDQGNVEQALEFGTREFTGAATGMLFAAGLFYTGYQLKSCPADCFEQNVYIALASSSYAVLTGIGVFLECAYRFDRYGWRAIKMLPSMFLVAAGAMFAALAAAEYHLPDKIGYAFVSGCALLIIGAGISCFLAGYILPGEQITAARMPTQSAFAAFCKNTLIYFFPIYAIFGLLVFCLIYSSSPAARNVAYPIGFFIVLLIFFVISHFSTNVLLQNLLTPKDGDEYRYYGMFSSLIMFRAIFMFGAALVSLIYYFTSAARY